MMKVHTIMNKLLQKKTNINKRNLIKAYMKVYNIKNKDVHYLMNQEIINSNQLILLIKKVLHRYFQVLTKCTIHIQI